MVRMSILGLDNYTNGAVWDLLALPDDADRSLIIAYIEQECAELGLLYTDPDTVRSMIGVWSRKNLDNWGRILTALTEEYNPLHNYDRIEEWTDAGKTQVAGFDLDSGMADRDAGQSTHTGRVRGNIGVVSSATMLSGEIEVRMQYTFADVILDSFKKSFCILVY